jgi:hypothetical protein
MHTRWTLRLLAVAIGAALAAAAPSAQAPVTETTAEGIREHLDEAEDLVDDLLQWRHVLTHVSPQSSGAPTPTAPANTLIGIGAAEVKQLQGLIGAAVRMLPAAASAGTSRGDLAAHLRKAQEIASELTPAAAPVGTSGTDRAVVMIDRTALLRLEIELEAAEQVAPRRLDPERPR